MHQVKNGTDPHSEGYRRNKKAPYQGIPTRKIAMVPTVKVIPATPPPILICEMFISG
jgi:hypothetical protein